MLRPVTALLLVAACGAAETAPLHAEAAIRSLGSISATATRSADGAVHTAYVAADAAAARSLASKRLADLRGFGDLRLVRDAGLPGTVLELAGTGAWLLATEGATVHELYAPERARLAAHAGKGWQPVAERVHPRWLDCFDNAAFGFWNLGGGVLPQDLDADLAWFGANGFTICAVGTNEDRAVAPGVVDTSVMDFYSAKAAEHDVPWRMLLWWQHPQRPRYTWNLEPLPHVRTAAGGVAVDNPDYQRLAAYCGFEPIPATDAYLADARRTIAAHAGADPRFIGHHGAAEVPKANPIELAGAAGSPHIQALWRQWLREVRGWSLAEVGERHRGDAKAFSRWEDVPIPGMDGYVAGAAPIDLRGAGAWQVRADPQRQGVAGRWFADTDQPGWQVRDIQDPVLLLLGKGADGKPAGPWYRRSFTVDAAQAQRVRFLHLGRTGWHGTDSAASGVWINGEPLKELTDHHPVHNDHDQCFELGAALRPGANTIVLDGRGCTYGSYLLLSEQGRWAYPSPDALRNARWYDSTEFSAWLRLRWLGDSLAATRSGEPFRPQKIMAPWEFLGEAISLGERYGAYIHETGMGGAVWCPWLDIAGLAGNRLPCSSTSVVESLGRRIPTS
jgi:hypothetical protein